MGKGGVNEHTADCEYEIQTKYNRETFDRRIEQLNNKIVDIDLRISEIEDALDYGGV